MPDKAKTGSYTIVKLDQSNIADLGKLHTTVYGSAQAGNYYLKKYDTAYTGITGIGLLAYNNAHIPIAFYGMLPCFIQYENKIILAAQSADALTHPGYRHQNLFSMLCNGCVQWCRESSIRFVFGFPNQDSYHIFMHKLGWSTSDRMDYFLIPVNAASVEKLCAKSTLTKKIYEKYVHYVLGKLLITEKGLPNILTQEGYAGILRSKDYLRYKTYNPTYVLKIGCSKIWIKISHHITIGDIELGENNFDLIIATIKKISKRLGIKAIYFHSCSKTILHTLFSEKYPPQASFPVIYKDFDSGLPLEKIKFTFADIDIF
ncbi:hypothetical protein BH10BAC2_BH10BAC2_47810 [soil metagenome]